MIEIKGLGGAGPIFPEEIEKERLKDIKSRVAKVAYATLFGEKRKVSSTTPGIAKAEGALKWIEEVMKKEEWKGS